MNSDIEQQVLRALLHYREQLHSLEDIQRQFEKLKWILKKDLSQTEAVNLQFFALGARYVEVAPNRSMGDLFWEKLVQDHGHWILEEIANKK